MSTRPRRRRAWRVAAGVAAALVIGFTTVSALWFVWPSTDRPTHVDIILSLNGNDESARASEAVDLARAGYARVLLFSRGSYGLTPCPQVRGVQVVCFIPDPGRTVGEVEFAARYARRFGWKSVIVVPSTTQTTRARIIAERCFPGRVLVIPASTRFSNLWYELLYEWGATAKALVVDRGCR